jgi:hypothetical protein
MRFASPLVAIGILGMAATTSIAASLTARWGLQSDFLYEEAREPPGETSAAKSSSTVRAFRKRQLQYEEALMTFLKRHTPLVDLYRKSYPQFALSIPREAFVAWVKDRDPVHVADGMSLAPVLYFDFIGDYGKQYVLDKIIVQTVRFEEYKGGGYFPDQLAWYDVELSTMPGFKTYQVDRKLKFVGAGRAEIRLWSSNYYPTAALTPLGSYLISMRFVFLVDGDEVSFDTGQFRIDA